ncbi:amidohydrolase family protein [Ignicoccus hospitalis]|uniref:Amidohydrolase n=1 Tax=Ignicoccus hospitalis (strain KIN4/I / DSM 18386 / JCM 14125) TaxID=453591 RepID=A8A9H9_IGNH4|nr:amidohydrolase family protein [Ignicoccus hospitalis]ABU81581.1 amidohydrolase [Ignicoccus hospitalis KIN4/I]HIH90516.1 amidohydrolase family protein [Desulfurococcaceae archaeon]
MKVLKFSKLYVGDGSVLKDVYVGFEGEEITYVGGERPEGELLGEFPVGTPALVDPHSHIGMDRAGEPYYEEEANETMDSLLPYLEAQNSVYMDDKAFEESVEWGVLYSAVTHGSGNIIGGKVALLRNWKKNVRDAFIKHVGVKAALGYNPRSTTSWRGTRPSTRMGVIALFKKAFDKAAADLEDLRKGKKEWKDLEPTSKALVPVLEGRLPLRVHVHKEDDIAVLISLAKTYGFKYTIDHACDVHTEEGFKMIKESGASLVYGPVDSHPYKVELKHESYKNIKLLIKYMPEVTALMSDHPVVLQRNLMLQLRYFMMYGMPFEEAIKLVTGNAAKVVGLNAGEVKVGKLVSLVAWNGEPYVLGSAPELVVAEGEVLEVRR